MTLEDLQLTEELFRSSESLRSELHKALSIPAVVKALFIVRSAATNRRLPVSVDAQTAANAFQQGAGGFSALDKLITLTQKLPETGIRPPDPQKEFEAMGQVWPVDPDLQAQHDEVKRMQEAMAAKAKTKKTK